MLHPPAGSDYFIFRRNQYLNIPDFTVGRPCWDNWMIYEARLEKIPTIDGTPKIMIIHQNHDYFQATNPGIDVRQGDEAMINLSLAGGKKKIFDLSDTNYLLTKTGLVKKPVTYTLWKKYINNTPEILPGPTVVWQFSHYATRFLHTINFFPQYAISQLRSLDRD